MTNEITSEYTGAPLEEIITFISKCQVPDGDVISALMLMAKGCPENLTYNEGEDIISFTPLYEDAQNRAPAIAFSLARLTTSIVIADLKQYTLTVELN